MASSSFLKQLRVLDALPISEVLLFLLRPVALIILIITKIALTSVGLVSPIHHIPTARIISGTIL